MDSESSDHAQIQKKPEDATPPPPSDDIHSHPQPTPQHSKSVHWSTELTREFDPQSDGNMPPESDPHAVTHPPVAPSSKVSMEKVKEMLGKWGKKAKEAGSRTEDYAENVWQHLKMGSGVADTVIGRIAHTTKVLTEGGSEKMFRNTFEILPDEKLKKSFACYLSTSAGPVIGTLYISTLKLAFCSDKPCSYQVEEKKEWSFYKVVIPLQQLRKVNPTTSKDKHAEKYIQVVSIDNYEFWFMGFVNYNNAVKCLQEVASHERGEA